MKKKRYSTHAQKILWLIEHQSFWAGITASQTWRQWDLKMIMQEHGLYSPSTRLGDIGVWGLIVETRALLRQQAKERVLDELKGEAK